MRNAPPLLGYNNNVRYLGRTFHIQTEDSGIKYARIMTHLFMDGGRIVKSTKTEYGAVLGQPDMAQTVRRMMKEQHKNMFLSLRAGDFDSIIERVARGGQSTPAVETAPSQRPHVRADSLPSLSFGAGGEARTMPGMRTLVIDSTSSEADGVLDAECPTKSDWHGESTVHPAATVSAKRLSSHPRKAKSTYPPAPKAKSTYPPAPKAKSTCPPAPKSTPLVDGLTRTGPSETKLVTAKEESSERPSRKLGLRPTTSTQEAIDPRTQSIFGDTAAGRQTLDEVILSFLEDEDT